MIIEYYNYDIASNDIELKKDILESVKFSPNTISVLPQSLKFIKSIIPDSISLSCPIDFPLGYSDFSIRKNMIEYAIQNGASKLDLILPSNLVCNRKYTKLREELKFVNEFVDNHKILIRYILEYRTFNSETLYKVCKMLSTNNIFEVFPSSGFGLDNIYDNILAGSIIMQKVPSIKIINNGNVWNQKQIDDILNLNLYGIKVNTVNALKMICKKK